jgi:uncharacterized protein YegL
MAQNDNYKFTTEAPPSLDAKCCLILALDVSGSMSEPQSNPPINSLNQGIKILYDEVKEDDVASQRLEIGIVTFDSKVNVVMEPKNVYEFNSMPHLSTGSTTALVDGAREAIRMARAAKKYYKDTNQDYYRPWIILITDGGPDENQDVLGLASEVKFGMDNKDFHFFAVGVEGANMQVLEQISHPTKMRPRALQGLKFKEFFEWLSKSMGTITNSTPGAGNVDISSGMDDWGKFEID